MAKYKITFVADVPSDDPDEVKSIVDAAAATITDDCGATVLSTETEAVNDEGATKDEGQSG